MQDDYSAWFIGKDFSTDWSSKIFSVFVLSLSERRDKIVNVLEIGSWEGRSTIFFLNFFRHCKVTAIDTFAGSPEHIENPAWAKFVPDCEWRFDANLAEYGPRVEKIKARSCEALARLAIDLRRFDFIYVDGSHHSTDVYTDAAMAWPMLVRCGIIVFDDYGWTMMQTAAERPKLGVDAFLAGQDGQYRELYRGYVMIVEKI
jgi:predicted O-methyltransferase YrrM